MLYVVFVYLFKGEIIAIVGESGSGKIYNSKSYNGNFGGNGFINNGTIIFKYTNEKEKDKKGYNKTNS